VFQIKIQRHVVSSTRKLIYAFSCMGSPARPVCNITMVY
jgi:hypothetical protein